jgi:hypothetical protein
MRFHDGGDVDRRRPAVAVDDDDAGVLAHHPRFRADDKLVADLAEL